MKLRNRIVIAAGAQAIWPYIADPIQVSRWNPKLVSIDRDREGPVRDSERYRVIFQMRGKERESEVVVVSQRPYSHLHIQYYEDLMNREQYVEETYDLQPVRDGTRLTQVIDMGRVKMPLLLRWLGQLILWFGKPVGPTHLEQLRQLVEGDLNAEPQGDV